MQEDQVDYVPLYRDQDFRKKWLELPLKDRRMILYKTEQDDGVLDKLMEFSLNQWGTDYIHHKATSFFPSPVKGGKLVKADTRVLDWIVNGETNLRSHNLKDVIAHAVSMENIHEILPCRVKYLNKPLGVVLSLPQFISFTSFIFFMGGVLGILKGLERFGGWLRDNTVAPTGLCTLGGVETAGTITSAFMGELKSLEHRLYPEKGHFPLLLGQVVNLLPEPGQVTTWDTEVRFLFLHNALLAETMPQLRKVLPSNLPALLAQTELKEEDSILPWIDLVVKAYTELHPEKPLDTTSLDELKQIIADLTEETPEKGLLYVSEDTLTPEDEAHITDLVQSIREIAEISSEGVGTPPFPADAAGEEPEKPTPVTITREDIRKAKRLEYEQKLNEQPNLLEGLDAYDILLKVAKNGGVFEKEFKGTPIVIERLREEAGENKREKKGEGQCGFSRVINGPEALTTVTKGNLVFTNRAYFEAVEKLRYAGRQILRERGETTDKNRPHIQVLAPHEFSQVPGFVAGQHRDVKDRLGVVIITYDPQLWTCTFAQRKVWIFSSNAPMVWCYPREWLVPSFAGSEWWKAGWFGTPKDSAITQFMVPNQNYDI